MLCHCSTSTVQVLDGEQITEPGLQSAYVPSENVTYPSMGRSMSESFAAEALKQAEAQAQSGTELDRVSAALEKMEAEDEASGKKKKYNIILISSEVARFAKSGGLADVADKLSASFAKRGHRVMTVMPMYGYYDVSASAQHNRSSPTQS